MRIHRLLLGLCFAFSLALLGQNSSASGDDSTPPPAFDLPLEGPGPLAAKVATGALKVPEDLRIQQVLAEPIVQQPLQLSFDERGRLWVMQYLQYPHPAGLKLLSKDGNWRVHYDKVPPPPPHHFVGADKITIHEDTDGDGLFDKHKTFLEGLNIATSCARGRGGVWVLNPPYLLFYPDRNNDDIPDGDPEVHLEGFGLEDTHSCANSLRFGPDGWLYAAQGSTVTGAVIRPGVDKIPVNSMGQLIWRYHPEQRKYEVFAEGGGNTFGVEIDSKGRIFSGHNGGDTRGFHYVQGGYSQKGFNKHGPLSNPYAFGYFAAMHHPPVPRFTHTFAIYEGGLLPTQYERKLFAVSPILHQVVLSDFQPEGSTWRTKDIEMAVESQDSWFSPVDIKHGPDGSLYIADWYDGTCSHLRNHEGEVSKATGRIYRLTTPEAPVEKPFDLTKTSTTGLIELLSHKNRWYRETALRLLGDRKDASAIEPLTRLLFSAEDRTTDVLVRREPNLAEDRRTKTSVVQGQTALEALWALNLSGGFNDQIATRALKHEDAYVRLWTVRLLCDFHEVSPPLANQLVEMAQTEPHYEARSQLACSARRLPVSQGLPIVLKLLTHTEDAGDLHIPLLLWWAMERFAAVDSKTVLSSLEKPDVWELPLFQQQIEERLMRRFALAGTRQDLAVCTKLLQLSPGKEHTQRLMAGFEAAFVGRSVANLPTELLDAMSKFGKGSLILDLRQGKAEAVAEVLKSLEDEKTDLSLKVQYVSVLGEVDQPQSIPVVLKLATEATDANLRAAALLALQRYDLPEIGTKVLSSYSQLTEDVRIAAQMLLSSRTVWAKQFLAAVEQGQIDPRSIPADIVARLELSPDKTLRMTCQKLWGANKSGAPEEFKQEVTRLLTVLNDGRGIPKTGRTIFLQQCGKCHLLHGQGGKVGPDLTTYKRDDLINLLTHIVNPSAQIREGFATYVVETKSGRLLTGILLEQDDKSVTLRSNDSQQITIARDEIEEMMSSKKSLMPEGLLKQYSEQEVRDLFAYLRSTQPIIDP